jgi:ATP-dependent Clp protease protease subunit
MKIKRMFAAAKKAEVLELYVYNTIGEDWFGGGVTPDSVQKAIKDAGTFSSITVHLNSPGGDSFDGVAIHNILRQQGVPVNVIVEGLAASAAFTIAEAGDTIAICDGAMMMLHNAWSIAIGDARDMRAQADLLDKVSGTLRDLYAKRSGMGAEQVQQLMDIETWLTADEAVEKGFATEKKDTTPEKSAEAKALSAQYDLKKFCSKVPDTFKAEEDEGGEPLPEYDPDGDEDDPDSAAECSCSCDACKAGNCKDCSMKDCKDENCTHAEEDMEAKAASEKVIADKAAHDVRARRLKIAEITAP